jgi:ERCC4-type nuclease
VKIVVDTREQDPLPFEDGEYVIKGLEYGDYSFVGGERLFSVERKSVADLTACCCNGKKDSGVNNRARFERELKQLRAYRFKRLLIIGQPEDVWARKYRSRIHPNAVMGSVSTWEVRYDIPVVWAMTQRLGAGLVRKWARIFAEEFLSVAKAIQKGDTG